MPDPLDTHTLLPLWEHPLGEVFALGDGDGALQLTVLRKAVAGGELAMNQCVDTNTLLSEMQAAAIPPLAEARRLEDGRLVLAYGLLEGTTLGQHMLEGALEAERVIAILRQLCRALDVAHGFGIRHGALSLSSVVLVEHDGREDTVRLLDFGLEDELGVEAMGDHEVELQPLSPEKVAGRMPDQREDVYLLGALGYAALTGHPVFQGDGEAVRAAHAERSPDALHCDAPLAAVILRCLSKDPAKRYPDMGSVDDALVGAQEVSGLVTPWDDLRPMAGSSASGSHRKSSSGLGGLGRIPTLGAFKPPTGLRPAAKVESKKSPAAKVELPKVELPKVEPLKVEPPKVEPKKSPSASATFDAIDLIEDLRPSGDSESSSPPPPPPAKRKGEPSGRHATVPVPPRVGMGTPIPAPPATGPKGKAQSSGSSFDRAAALGLGLGRSSNEPRRTPSGKVPAVPPVLARGKGGDSKPSPAAVVPVAKPETSEEADTAEQAKPSLPKPTPKSEPPKPTLKPESPKPEPELAQPETSEEADTAEQAKPQLPKPVPVPVPVPAPKPSKVEADDERETDEQRKPKVAATPAHEDEETAVRPVLSEAERAAVVMSAKPVPVEGAGAKVPRWLLAAGVVLLVGLPAAWLLTRGDAPSDAAAKPTVAAAQTPEAQMPEAQPPEAQPPEAQPPEPKPVLVADPSAPEGETAVASGGEPDVPQSASGADDGGATPDDGEDAAADDGAAKPADGGTVKAKPTTAAAPAPKDKARELIRAGDKAYASGQIGKAEERYQAALAENPRAHAAAAGLGKIAFNKASYASAATHYGRAVKAAGSNAQYRILYGDALFKLGKYAEAKTQYAKAKSLGNKQADGRLDKVKAKLGG